MRTFKKAILLILAGLLAITPVVLIVCAGMASAGKPVFGLRFFIVQSNSMRPALNSGDMIIVKACKPEDVRVGDIITYEVDHRAFVTHRVTEILGALDGGLGLRFVTKGDANNVRDMDPVEPAQLVGKMSGRLPGLGARLERVPGQLAIALPAMMVLLLLCWPAAALLIWLAVKHPQSRRA